MGEVCPVQAGAGPLKNATTRSHRRGGKIEQGSPADSAARRRSPATPLERNADARRRAAPRQATDHRSATARHRTSPAAAEHAPGGVRRAPPGRAARPSRGRRERGQLRRPWPPGRRGDGGAGRGDPARPRVAARRGHGSRASPGRCSRGSTGHGCLASDTGSAGFTSVARPRGSSRRPRWSSAGSGCSHWPRGSSTGMSAGGAPGSTSWNRKPCSAAPPETSAQRNPAGSVARPRSVVVEFQAGSPASESAGARRASSRKAIRPSRRASGAPRQK